MQLSKIIYGRLSLDYVWTIVLILPFTIFTVIILKNVFILNYLHYFYVQYSIFVSFNIFKCILIMYQTSQKYFLNMVINYNEYLLLISVGSDTERRVKIIIQYFSALFKVLF